MKQPQGAVNPDDRAAAVQRRRWAGVALVAAALLLYLLTLDNGFQSYELGGGDLITHQYAQVQARPSNAPGYPLYTMGGWIWFHGLRPLASLFSPAPPNPIPILSSYSTLWALLAVWLLYAIICRVTVRPRWPAGNWPIAWLIGVFYTVTYFFWYYATTTEQYSSAIAQTLAIVYVYLLWSSAARAMNDREGEAAAADPLRSTRLLFLLAFLCGLSLAHMLTIALIVPPLVAVVLWQAPYLLRSPRVIFGSVIAAALPLLGYLYVYLRGAAHPEWWGEGEWATAGEWFWAFVSTAQGREELGWGFEPGAAFFGNGFPELMWQELSIPFFILGILGILLLDRKLAALLYGFSALTLIFSWAYRYGNWYQVILPVYPLLLIGVAAVVDRLESEIALRAAGASPTVRRSMQAVPLLLLIGAIIWRIDGSLPEADSRNRPNDSALDRAAVLLDQSLPPGAGLFAAVEDALALQYLTEIWGLGAATSVVSSGEAGGLLTRGVPVLATWEATPTLMQEAASASARQPFGPDWITFLPEGATGYDPLLPPVLLPASEGDLLAAYGATSSPRGSPVFDAPAGLDITLIWQPGDPGWPDGLNISVRPTRNGEFIPDPAAPGAILQQDRPEPANGLGDPQPLGAPQLLDPYRFVHGEEADGVMVILYRAADGGFENVAELRLPLDDPPKR